MPPDRRSGPLHRRLVDDPPPQRCPRGHQLVPGRVLVGRPGPLAAWIVDECTLLALAGFWVLLPLRERGSQDTAQPGL